MVRQTSLINLFINLPTIPNKKNTGLVNLSIYYTWKNIKSVFNKN